MSLENAPDDVAQAFNACTPRQRALAIALAKGMGREDAMLEAGYSKVQAHKTPAEVLDHPRVVKIATWLGAQAVQKQVLTVERVVEEAARIVLADIRTIFDENGNILPIHEMPDDIARCVAGIDVSEEYTGKGDKREVLGYTKKLKFWNKLDAIEKVAKIQGWYKEKLEVDVTDKLADALRSARERAANR